MYLRLVMDEITKTGSLGIKPKILMTRGDVLDRSTRRLLETRLKCDVFDTYGANDAGPIAWQCSEKSGYHLDAEYTICEFLKDNQPVGEGEPGEITITNLVNYAEPMIRYRLGDIGTYSREDCPCRRTLPILKSIEGRSSEFIHLPDGRSITPKSLLETMLAEEGSPRFQVVKGGGDGDGNSDCITILRLFGLQLQDGVSDRMIKTSRDLFGEGIRVERSPDLPKAKIRPVVALEGGKVS
jgi:phenylacetate-CoA ligase